MKTMTGAAFATMLLAGAAAHAQDAKPPLLPEMAAPAMKIETPVFVKTVRSSDELEIRSSQLATDKATGADVKAFAKQMIADHTKASEELKAIVFKGQTPPPTAPLAPKHRKMLSQLEAATGSGFDVLYIDIQSQAHMEAVGLFRTYVGSGDAPEVMAFAAETLPTLEMHMEHVKKLVAGH